VSKARAHESAAEQLQRDVDKLIDRYETPGVRMGGSVLRVECFKADLVFAVESPNGDMHYRGRILLPVARKKSKVYTADQVRWDE